MTYGKRPPLDEQKSLWEASVAREGVTTDPGAVIGNSLIDAGLIGFGANSFEGMLVVVYPGQPNLVDSFDVPAGGFNTITGEVALNHNYKGGRILAGVPYKIVTFRFVPAEVAALAAALAAHEAAQLASRGEVTSIETLVAATAAGKTQPASTTISLNQVAATYDLFTGTDQDVLVEGLVLRMPDVAAGGALTSISIQTDDTTPQIFVSAATGAVANLTQEAQCGYVGLIKVVVGAKIRLTIVGGATGFACTATVDVLYRAKVAGGYLA